MRATLAGIVLSCACLGTLGVPARAVAAVDPGARLLGHLFVDDAYRHSGDTAIPAQLSAREAQIVLQLARDVDPENTHTLKLLVEASTATGNTDVEREALRGLIKLDPGDLVAQVQYIDLIAAASQALDERAKVYQAALGKTALDPQIRSEVAVRLARIARERGDIEGAKGLVKQALELNDVNVGALREGVQLAKEPVERLQALVNLLTINPLEPAAWVESARLLESANLHAQAADYLMTALEQMQLDGQQPPADVYLAVGIDLSIASRFAEAYPIVSTLSRLPNAPLNALVAMHLLSAEYTAPASMPGAASQPSADELAGKIHKLLANEVKANPKSVPVLANALWTELSVFPQPAPETADWLKEYQQLVPAEDATVARFHGWQLLRAGNLDDARQALENAGDDPYAKLGLAHLLVTQKKIGEAAPVLQSIWNNHPTGIFALQVAETAYKAGGQGIRLSPPSGSEALLQAAKQLPATAMTAHRQTRDYELITTAMSKREYAYGEPILLTIRISNTAPTAAPVGPDGLIKTTFGILANLRGAERQNLGLVRTEDLRRVFRLERRVTMETTIRLDQGRLDTLLQNRPMQVVNADVALITAPQGTTANPAPGLGGQLLSAGEFQRNPFPMRLPTDADKLVESALASTGSQQMIRAQMLGVAAAALAKKATGNSQPAPDDDPIAAARDKVDHALASLLDSASPALRAYVLMTVPPDGIREARGKLDKLSEDPDRIVRAAWAARLGAFATQFGDPQALAALQKQAGVEKDALVREWMSALIEEAKTREAQPMTQAATEPAATQ
ncbi:MAG: HEAT repeat domain-containing protein [Phycisphaerae bacterium]